MALRHTTSPYQRQSEKALKKKLNTMCLLVADTLTWFSPGELTETMIDTIPGIVYLFAVELGMWLQPEPGTEAVTFGPFDIPKAERERFVSLVEESMSYLRRDLEEQRTPLDIYLAYKKEHGLTWPNLAKSLGVGEAHLRQRLCNPKYTGSKRSTLEPIAATLGCDWRDLRWHITKKPDPDK